MARISEEKIAEIRSTANIVHYISQFVNLKKAGQNFKGLCPFHTEKTPSFVVSPEKQIFHCFGCGKGGNLYSFIMDYEKLPFQEALQKAADFAGIVLPKQEEMSSEKTDYLQSLYHINEIACTHFEANLQKDKNKNWLQYFLDRDISKETIASFRLGYAEDSFNQLKEILIQKGLKLSDANRLGLIQQKDNKQDYYDKFRHRVIFPFFNVSGKIIGFGGRKLKEEQQPKYLNSPESPIYYKGKILYGLHAAINSIRSKGFVILVEGYFDLLRLVEVGIKNVVASSGTALGEDQAKLLRRYTRDVYIAYDGDEAGVKAALRSAQIVEQTELNAFIIPLPLNEDPDSLITSHGAGAFEKLLDQKKQPVEFEIDRFELEHKLPSLDQKERFISQMLENFVGLKNQLKLGLYIHQLADRMQINESLVIEQLNRLKRTRKRFAPASTKSDETVEAEKDSSFRSGIYKAESGVIALLLIGSTEVQNFIIEHIEHSLFEDEVFIKIYEQIIHDREEHGLSDTSKIVQEFQEDSEATKALSELALLEISEPQKFARDCIYQLKKWNMEKRSREISHLIKTESESTDELLHYTQELAGLRKEINQLEIKHRNKQLD